MKIAFVRWSEVTGHQGWQGVDDASAMQPGECYSSGFIVHDGSDWLVLAGTRSDDGRVNGIISIPRGAIVEMTVGDTRDFTSPAE